ncbi:hypothetical protein GQ55_7G112800 [Panicum hallii var. hallii]|uniref:Uncharacterized protein n=1 Tax=Panicum hallii var. hallii TaxID=1504633 RepID=A0A2T7CTZ8_9POAL|nr:hypothetical protein GQ55_7G112800 [Panicum hallii var. hallii]
MVVVVAWPGGGGQCQCRPRRFPSCPPWSPTSPSPAWWRWPHPEAQLCPTGAFHLTGFPAHHAGQMKLVGATRVKLPLPSKQYTAVEHVKIDHALAYSVLN